MPVNIVKKYSLIPIDKLNDNLSVVMENPLDEKAIKAIEDITGCKVRRLLGVHEEIQSSIKHYYDHKLEAKESALKKEEIMVSPPSYEHKRLPAKRAGDSKITRLDTEEKRQFFRFKCNITISFPTEGTYQKSKTFDISYSGISFKSPVPIAAGSYLIIKVESFRRTSDFPIVLLAQVIRRTQVDKKNFCIGARILQTTKENINKIVNYANTHKVAAYASFDRLERRKYPRFKAKFNLWFPDKDDYSKTETIDVSLAGLSFRTRRIIKIGSYLPLQIELPKDICKYPVALLVQVTRVKPVQKDIFKIGAKIINVSENQIEELIRYVSRNAYL